MTRMKHWQDVVNGILGIWLIVSAWVVGFHGETAPTANAVIVGILLLLVALGAIYAAKAWEEWSELVLGLWMIASPWVLSYQAVVDARANAVIVGLIVAILALWVLLTDRDYGAWRKAPQ